MPVFYQKHQVKKNLKISAWSLSLSPYTVNAQDARAARVLQVIHSNSPDFAGDKTEAQKGEMS